MLKPLQINKIWGGENASLATQNENNNPSVAQTASTVKDNQSTASTIDVNTNNDVNNKNKVEINNLKTYNQNLDNQKNVANLFAESKVATNNDWTNPANKGFHQTAAGWTKRDVGFDKEIGVAKNSDIKITKDNSTRDTLKDQETITVQDPLAVGVNMDVTVDHNDLKTNRYIQLGSIAVLNKDSRTTRWSGDEIRNNREIIIKQSNGESLPLGYIELHAFSYDDNTMERDLMLKITASEDQLKELADDVHFTFDMHHIMNIDNDGYQYSDLKGTSPNNPTQEAIFVSNKDGSIYKTTLNITFDGNKLPEYNLYNSFPIPSFDVDNNVLRLNSFNQKDLGKLGTFKGVYKLSFDQVNDKGNRIGTGISSNTFKDIRITTADMPKYVMKDGNKYINHSGFHSQDVKYQQKQVANSLDANALLQQTPENSIYSSFDPETGTFLVAYNLDPTRLQTKKDTLENFLNNSLIYNIADPTQYGFKDREDFKNYQLKYYADRNYTMPTTTLFLWNFGINKNLPMHVSITDVTPGSETKTYTTDYSPNGSKVDVSFWRTANIHYISKDSGKTISNDTVTGVQNKTSNVKFVAPAGYALASGQADNVNYFFKDTGNEINVYVAAQNQTIPIHYVDDDANGAEVASDTISAKTDDSYAYDATKIPANYELANGQSKAITGVVKPTNNNIVIHLKHMTEPITESRTIIETINYLDESNNKIAASHTQSATVNWRGTKDLVNGKKTGAWSTAKFAPVDSPVIKGYKPNIQTIEEIVVTDGSTQVTRNVVYKANDEQAKLVFFDDTANKALDTKTATGKFGKKIDFGNVSGEIEKYQKQHYVFVTSDFANQAFADDTDLNSFIIHFTHATALSPLTHDVTRVIKYQYEDGTKAGNDVTDSLHFTGTRETDLVTNQVVNDTWSENQDFKDVSTSSIVGYTPTMTVVSNKNISHATPNISVMVIYKANDEKAVINYIDDTTGKILKTEKVNGKFNQNIVFETKPADVINNYLKEGYDLISNSFSNNKYREDISKNTFNVHFKHHISEVTDPKMIKSSFTRIITLYIPNGSGARTARQLHQYYTITRTGTQDQVTKEYKFSNWTTAQVHEDKGDVFDGYTAQIQSSNPEGIASIVNGVPTVKAESFTGDNKALTGNDVVEKVVFVYAPNDQKAKVFYIDSTDGKILEVNELIGKSDSNSNYSTKKKISNYQKQGYDLVKDDSNGQDIIYDAKDKVDQNYIVNLKHHISSVTDKNMLTASFSRTVTVHLPDGQDKEIKQHYDISRTGTQDQVTKEYKFSDWTMAQVHEDKGEVLDGYTAQIKSSNPEGIASIVNDVPTVKAETFTGDNKALNGKNVVEHIEISYTPNDQKAKISYIDDTTGKVLEVKDLVGKSNVDSGYVTKDKITEYQKQGYDLVKDDTNGQDIIYDAKDKVDQNYEVHLKHHISPVTDTRILTASFNRTVTVHLPDGQDKEIKQHYDISRTGTQDQVTKEYKFSDWTMAQVHEDKGDTFTGYTAQIKSSNPEGIASIVNGVPNVKAETFTNENGKLLPKNLTEKVEISYSANLESAIINYVDDTTGKIIKTVATSGYYGDAIKFNPDVKSEIADLLSKGYVLVSNDFNNQNYQDDVSQNMFTVHLKHKTAEVTKENTVKESVNAKVAPVQVKKQDVKEEAHVAKAATITPTKVTPQKNELPQTGSSDSEVETAIGLATVGLSGLLGLGFKKKKED